MASGMTQARGSFALSVDKVAGHASSLTLAGIAAEDEIVAAISLASSVPTDRLGTLTAGAGAVATGTNLASTAGVIIAWLDLSAGGRVAICPRFTVVSGDANATNIAVTDITTLDSLIGVIEVVDTSAALNDRKSEASITSNGNIQLSTTDTTGNKLIVIWLDNNSTGTGALASYPSGCLKAAVVTGANADTSITLTGIATDDVIVGAIKIGAAGAVADIRSESSIYAANTVRFTGSTASTYVWVFYWDTSA